MQYFYDGQIRKYLVQIIRLLSNFVVRYSDGSLVRVPVTYGDVDRQAAAVLNQNSENTVPSAPRIGVYITDLELDTSRLADASFVGKVHIRERAIDIDDEGNEFYTSAQGDNYTVERLMPTPYKLTVKVDIWSTSIDQKLQILEQILMLFNPSLEIQTTDNYIDWTSLSVVDLSNLTFSSRTIPSGTSSDIDIATLTLITPAYISPPAKVKRLGVVTNVVANILGTIGDNDSGYVDGLGVDLSIGSPDVQDLFCNGSIFIRPGNFDIEVLGNQVRLVDERGQYTLWKKLIDQHGQYRPGLSRIYLRQPNDTNVVGTFVISPVDETAILVNWDVDTYPYNSEIPGPVRSGDSSKMFNAIIDPQKTRPDAGLPMLVPGTRYLILEDIGGGYKDMFVTDRIIQRINTNVLHRKVKDHKVYVNDVEVGSGNSRIPDDVEVGNYYIILDEPIPADSTVRYELIVNEDGPDAWKNSDNTDFIASANDIIEWSGTKWHIVFDSTDDRNQYVFKYQTNEKTGTQYQWNGVSWSKSFEGEYRSGEWRLEL
jgi:hypothetical protein